MPGAANPAVPTFHAGLLSAPTDSVATKNRPHSHLQDLRVWSRLYPAELVVEEVGSMGHSCVRSLEHFFYGIVGHVKDKRGSPSTDGARLRGLPIIGAVALVYPKNTKLSRLKMRHLLRIENTDASAIEALPPQPHIQVTQLAWILHDIWSQDTSMLPSCKPSQVLTQAQRRLPLPTQHFLNHEGLSHPSAHLAILANMMAPGNAASTEIPDDDSM